MVRKKTDCEDYEQVFHLVYYYWFRITRYSSSWFVLKCLRILIRRVSDCEELSGDYSQEIMVYRGVLFYCSTPFTYLTNSPFSLYPEIFQGALSFHNPAKLPPLEKVYVPSPLNSPSFHSPSYLLPLGIVSVP